MANRFLEHARAVHFALIATSFALLVASAIRPQVSLQRAFDQAKTAATLMQTNFAYKNLDAFSEKYQAPFIADKKYYMALSKSTAILEQIKSRFEKYLELPDDSLDTSSFDFASAVQSNGNLWQRMSDGGLLDRDPTLDEFEKAWNFYKDASAVVMDRDNPQPDRAMYFGRAVSDKDLTAFREIVHTHHDGKFRSEKIKVGLREDKDPGRLLAIPHWYVIVELDTDTTFAGQPVQMNEFWFSIPGRRNLDVDLQSEVLASAGPKTLRGTYDENFGDLEYHTKGLESLKLSQVIAYLRQRYQNDNQQIQLFGVQVPQSTISQWGILTLVACQTYLLLHLNQAIDFWRQRKTSFPWIALYPGRLARIVSLLSITALPLAAAGALGVQGWEGSQGVPVRLMIATVGLASVGLVLASVRAWPHPAAEV